MCFEVAEFNPGDRVEVLHREEPTGVFGVVEYTKYGYDDTVMLAVRTDHDELLYDSAYFFRKVD